MFTQHDPMLPLQLVCVGLELCEYFWTLYLGIRYEEHLRERVELRTGALWSPAALQRPPAADVAPRTCGTTARTEQTILPSTEANTMVRFYALNNTWNRF